MNKVVTWIAHEVKAVWLASSFFLACFLLIELLRYLFLAEYEIHAVNASTAALFALVVGKVVVVLDRTSFGDRSCAFCFLATGGGARSRRRRYRHHGAPS